MNEQERVELERLKERQARLELELKLLSGQLTVFEQRLNQPASQPTPQPAQPVPQIAIPRSKHIEIVREEAAPTARPPTPKPIHIEKPPPPIIAPAIPVQRTNVPVPAQPMPTPTSSTARESFSKCTCEACGGHIEFPTSSAGDTIPCPHCGQPALLSTAPRPIPVPPALPRTGVPRTEGAGGTPALPSKPAKEGSWELRLGMHWVPRIGIVMVLTALVFFGNLAYHNFISKLGPGGKISLLYLASAVLLGAGAWWQRKAAKESLKNYAQVLFAGGLAAVYFTTYAAHHVQQVQIIQSAGLDGALLLAWAGFMVWCADRKKSEVLALFAVGLAYYTSIISHEAGLFTLYSNLVLTLAAVFFLVRNRWAALSFASLVATYAAYAFWRFLHGDEWHWASPEEGLWTGTYFLVCYWAVFTAAVFLSKDEKFAGPNRASFLTMNNGAFFTMFLLTMLQVETGGFWKFSLIYGSVLLVLAELARRLLADEPLAKNSYLTQGLLLVTVGFISKFAGMQLALILAAESVVLLMMGLQRKNLVLQTGGYLSAAMAVGWGMDGMKQFDPPGLYLGMGLGALMMVNTLLVSGFFVKAKPADAGLQTQVTLRAQPSYFAVLALAIWFVVTWNNTAREAVPLVLAAEAMLLILSIYLIRVPEISLLGQGYLLLAQSIWIYDAFNGASSPPWRNPVLMLILAMGLSYWWQRQKLLVPDPALRPLDRLPVLGKNVVLFAGMYVAVKLAGGWDNSELIRLSWGSLCLPIGLGALMMADALLAHRQKPPASGVILRPQPSYSTLLALVVWLGVTWHAAPREYFPLVLAAEALLLTLSIYLLRVPEIPLLSQSYVLLAQVAWLGCFVLDHGKLPPWWNPLLLMLITLSLSHWWQKQKAIALRSEFGLLCQGLYALAIVGVLYFWLSPRNDAQVWLALTSLLAVGLTAYGVFARAWLLAACGQIFMLVSGAQFVMQLTQTRPHWQFALAPMAALGLLSFATIKWFERQPDPTARVSVPLLQIAMLYRWVALVMSIWWVCEYIPARERIWLLALLGLWVFLWSGLTRSREALLVSAAYTGTALALFWLPLIEAPTVYWPNLMVIILLLAQRQVARRLPDRYPLDRAVHGAIIVIGGLSLWLFLSRWVLETPGNSYLTASWAALALALFTAGIALRERMYRWLGLGILACALVRVGFIDIWKLQELYRILSFMALGIALLVLGFIYSKYQEKIREWL